MEDNVKIFENVYSLANEMAANGEKPFAIAAVLVLVGLQMYKTSLSDEDYEKMVDTLFNNRHLVKSLLDIQQYKNTLN